MSRRRLLSSYSRGDYYRKRETLGVTGTRVGVKASFSLIGLVTSVESSLLEVITPSLGINLGGVGSRVG